MGTSAAGKECPSASGVTARKSRAVRHCFGGSHLTVWTSTCAEAVARCRGPCCPFAAEPRLMVARPFKAGTASTHHVCVAERRLNIRDTTLSPPTRCFLQSDPGHPCASPTPAPSLSHSGNIASDAVPVSSITRGAQSTLPVTRMSDELTPGCSGRYSNTTSMLPRPGMVLVASRESSA